MNLDALNGFICSNIKWRSNIPCTSYFLVSTYMQDTHTYIYNIHIISYNYIWHIFPNIRLLLIIVSDFSDFWCQGSFTQPHSPQRYTSTHGSSVSCHEWSSLGWKHSAWGKESLDSCDVPWQVAFLFPLLHEDLLTPQSLKTTVCLSSNLGLSLDCWLASELIYGSHQAQLPFTDDIVSTGLYTGWWSAVALKNSGQVLWDHRHQPVRARAQGA